MRRIKLVATLMITGLLFSIFSAQLNVKINSSDTIKKFLESAQAGSKSKLVFVNNDSTSSYSMYYIDFSENPLAIHEIPAAKGGVMPVISPDGEYFVFAKGVNGDGEESKVSTAYICPLKSDGVPVEIATPAYVPRFVQNATVPTVIYSTCSKNPDPAKHAFEGCGAVVKKSFANGVVSAPDTVWKGGSYFGGLSWDEKYLSTAWLGTGSAIMLDKSNPAAKPDTIHLHLKNNATSKDTMIVIGVCNPSISSSRIYTDAMMFFDFGSGNLPAGCSNPTLKLPVWELHQLLFITRSNGSILRTFDQYYVPELSSEQYDAIDDPKDAKGQSHSNGVWDNPEWSNHPYLATAVVNVQRMWADTNQTTITWAKKTSPKNELISLINIKDQSFLTAVSAIDTSKGSKTNFLWPWFWAQIPDGFTEDTNWLSTAVHKPLQVHKIAQNITIKGSQIVSGKQITTVSLFDLKGKLLWKSSLPAYKITIPSKYLTPGTYCVNIQLLDKTSVMGKFAFTEK